jgi:hypothetical protein
MFMTEAVKRCSFFDFHVRVCMYCVCFPQLIFSKLCCYQLCVYKKLGAIFRYLKLTAFTRRMQTFLA